MTTWVYRNGVLAVDSMVSEGSVHVGTAKKWISVNDDAGGGYVVYAGSLGAFKAASAVIETTGDISELSAEEGFTALWVKADGSVWTADCGQKPTWYQYEAPFYAGGMGYMVALGAMAAGASAIEALRICCQYDKTTGFPMVVIRFGENNVQTVNLMHR